MRSLLGEDDIARALEVLAGPFVEMLKRTYKVGNSAAALTSLQRFIDQLIISECLIKELLMLLSRHIHGMVPIAR